MHKELICQSSFYGRLKCLENNIKQLHTTNNDVSQSALMAIGMKQIRVDEFRLEQKRLKLIKREFNSYLINTNQYTLCTIGWLYLIKLY